MGERKWWKPKDSFRVGNIVNGLVHSITCFGAFIAIEDNYKGLLHIKNMVCTKKIKHPTQVLQKGDNIECTIISIDKENNRVNLSCEFYMLERIKL